MKRARKSINRRASTVAGLAGCLLLLLPATPYAHEIPVDVTVRMFVKPEAEVLRVVVRAPLVAMRDIDFPLRGPGYLAVEDADSALRDAAVLWLGDYIRIYENGDDVGEPVVISVRASIPSDLSFATYDEAITHLNGPRLPPETDLFWEQAMLDVLFEYPIRSEASDFSIDPAVAHLGLRTVTVLRFITPENKERALQYAGNPGVVRLDPRWHHAAMRFIALGFEHILDGIDHLLFLLCLVIPVRRVRPLIAIVTSFTVAHSITLIASAMGLAPTALWFPPLIETLIALSIVYMALENIVKPQLEHRWLLAFGFGLLHGFGFSFALRETLQFAGSQLLTALVSFNIGVELGQLVVLLFMVPLLAWVFRRVLNERMGAIILSALLAHTAWHWMTDRGSELIQYQFQWPSLDTLFWVSAMRWLMLFLIVIGVLWALRVPFERLTGPASGAGTNLPPRTGEPESAGAKG